MERNPVTVRQLLPVKELDSCILRPNCLTSIISSSSTPPNAHNRAGQAGLYTKLCDQVFFSSTKDKEIWTNHILQAWAPCFGEGEKQAGASSTDQWNWATEVIEQLGRTLGLEGKSSLYHSDNNPRRCRTWTTGYFLPVLYQISHAQGTD